MPTPDDFFAIELRIGTVVAAEPFPEARRPAIKLEIDFGETVGRRQSSAQITDHYAPAGLVGRQVVGVLNIGARRIAGFTSEAPVLGGMTPDGVVLLAPDAPVANGTRVG